MRGIMSVAVPAWISFLLLRICITVENDENFSKVCKTIKFEIEMVLTKSGGSFN